MNADTRSEAAEMERLYALPPRWLAREIVSLVGRAREEVTSGGVAGYQADLARDLLWEIAPEIAYRLGETGARAGSSLGLATAGCKHLRAAAGFALVALSMDPPHIGGQAWRRLTRPLTDGNPLAIALDRVAPAGPGSTDLAARHLWSVSRAAGLGTVLEWTPELGAALRGDEADPCAATYAASAPSPTP